jgi:succinoglycan biosynthesis protein ExoA
MEITAQAQLWLRGHILLLGVIFAAASIGVACHVALRERAAGALLMPIAFLLLHVSYGVGTRS